MDASTAQPESVSDTVPMDSSLFFTSRFTQTDFKVNNILNYDNSLTAIHGELHSWFIVVSKLYLVLTLQEPG